MAIEIERSDANDRAEILALMIQARGDDLSDDERARRGFVQGQMNEAMLSEFQSGTGVFVARDGAALVGFCMTSIPGMAKGGPPRELVRAVTEALPEVSLDKIFLYGPVAVDRRYQGQGILTRLLLHACTELRARFELGALFVENSNRKSLAVHRHYRMDERAVFVFNDRQYVAFTFAPDVVVKSYCR